MSLHADQIILDGKYRIIELIGEGAMARVWLAEEPRFSERRVAIKEPKQEALTPEELADQEQRFRREVDVAAMLEQARVPRVVRALTLEELDDGTPLLVMEYAEGGSLGELLAEHPRGLPIDRTVQITRDICQALEAFHDLPAMPVHRDIKPANILFDDQGRAYLADFGLAQLPGRSRRSRMQAGPHPGTPLYMAPEQARSSEPLKPAADIYALGCVLFEMLTGTPYKRVKAGTKPGDLRDTVPAWLDRVVRRALAEEPWERYTDAGELVEALQQTSAPVRRWPTFLLGVLGIVFAASITWAMVNGSNGPPEPGGTPTSPLGEAATTFTPPTKTTTPLPSASRTPTETAEPSGRVATTEEEAAPTNTVTPSKTPPSPTRTPTPSTTLTPTNTPQPAVSETPEMYPAPELVRPEDDAATRVDHAITFRWIWNGTLAANEHFDLRVWKEGEPHNGITWTEDTTYTYRPPEPGTFRWSVAVIRGVDGQRLEDLSPEAPARTLTVSSSGGNGGDGGTGPYP